MKLEPNWSPGSGRLFGSRKLLHSGHLCKRVPWHAVFAPKHANLRDLPQKVNVPQRKAIGYFRVKLCLSFKTSL